MKEENDRLQAKIDGLKQEYEKIGLQVFHQWAIWDPSANNLAIVTSDGGAATIGN